MSAEADHPAAARHDHYYQLPGFASTVGLTIGLFRGSRRAGLQYLAENAHHPPRTVKGWYVYRQAKNNRMILGGLRQGVRDGLRLGVLGAAWVAAEEALDRVGLGNFREVGAGLAVSGAVAAVYRLPIRRIVGLGAAGGLCKLALRALDEAAAAAAGGSGAGGGPEAEAT